MSNSQERKRTRAIKAYGTWREWPALALPVALVVLAIWLPFGFSMSGLIEEWGFLGVFNIDGLFYVLSTTSPIPSQALRPLTILPQAIAYLTGPDSFFSWHVLLMLSLVAKGCAAAHLVSRASRSVRWGALMGVLVLLYPADTMQLSFRSIHIDWALALLLVGSSIFIEACRRRHKIASYALGALAAIFVLAANCMYEASLPLVVIPALVIYAEFGLKDSVTYLRRNFVVVAAWFTSVAIYIGYVAVTAPKITSYETSLMGGRSVFSILLASFPKLFSIGALRALVGGWYDAFRMVDSEFRAYPYLLLATAIIASVTLGMTRLLAWCGSSDEQVTPAKSWSPALRIAAAGTAMTLLGYAPFLLSPAHQAISQRTFLFATPGAAMVWVALMMLFWKWRLTKWPTMAAASLLILAGLGAQLVQFHHYVRISQTQKTLLKSIMQNFDGQLNGRTLLILDQSNQLGQTWMLGLGNLDMALTYLYGHWVGPVQICRMPNAEWQKADNLGRKGSCEETASEWILHPPSPVSGPGYVAPPKAADIHLAKDKVVTVTISPDGSAVANPALDSYRHSLMTADSTAARRYRDVLLAKHHVMNMFRDQPRYDQFHWNFGKWWSLEVVVRGTGWREPDWNSHGLVHQSSAWKTQDKGALYFDMSPSPSPHVLSGKFSAVVNDAIRRSMSIHLNGVALPIHWEKGNAFQTDVPAGVLQAKNNEIVFQSISDPKYYGLSAALVRFDIRAK